MDALDIRIASPCSVPWLSMEGNDKVRFCARCRLNVYDLTAMSWVEAQRLIARKEGRPCVRFYIRGDGTALTSDCPDTIRRSLSPLAARLVLLVLIALGCVALSHGREGRWLLRQIGDFIQGRPVEVVQGKMAN